MSGRGIYVYMGGGGIEKFAAFGFRDVMGGWYFSFPVCGTKGMDL